MRNLQKEYRNCISMLDKINMDYGTITDVTVNSRAKSRWGQCRHIRSDNGMTHTINISAVLLDERVPVEGLHNTIIHEILHTCPGCQNHGPEWKRRAAKVNKEFGFNIKRCNSAEEKGMPNEMKRDVSKKKYAVRCTKCGAEVRRTRLCSVIQHPGLYRCGACGGRLVRIR